MKFRKLTSLALVAVLAVSCLAGCGGKKAESSEGGGDTFKIGGIGPTTGSTAVYGLAVQHGAEMAVKEINEAGGINGAQIEFQFEDDENDAEKSVNAYNTLKDWGVQMILGSVTSTPSIAVGEETYNDNMFQLTPSGTAVECVQHENAFRVCFSDPSQGLESAKYIGENKLATKIAVIYDSSDTYSSGIYEAFSAEAKNQGLEIVAAEAFTADNKTDFSVQLQKAKDAGAELLFMPFYYQVASLVLKQAQGMNFDPTLADGLMFLAPFCPTSEDEAISTFVSAFEEEYGETPNQFAADAYDGIYILKQALESMDATPDMSASDLCDGLKTAMTEITYSGVTSPEIKWTADGEPEKAPMVLQIQNGEYVELQ